MFGDAHPIVDHANVQCIVLVIARHEHSHDAIAAFVAKGMVNHVLQQLQNHHRQRRGDGCRKSATVTSNLESNRSIARLQTLLRKLNERTNDLDERNVFPGFARQRFVHQCDGANTTHRIGNGILGFVRSESASL